MTKITQTDQNAKIHASLPQIAQKKNEPSPIKTQEQKPAVQVTLSEKAQNMTQLKNALEHVPEIREDRVKEYQKRIQDKEYVPASEKIAEGIVREAVKEYLAETHDA